MVTSSTRSACSVGEIRVVRLFRGVFLAMTIRLDIQLDRLNENAYPERHHAAGVRANWNAVHVRFVIRF